MFMYRCKVAQYKITLLLLAITENHFRLSAYLQTEAIEYFYYKWPGSVC